MDLNKEPPDYSLWTLKVFPPQPNRAVIQL